MEVSHAYLVLLFRKPTGTYQALSVFRVDGRRVVNCIIYVINTDFSGRRLLLSTARTRPCTIGFQVEQTQCFNNPFTGLANQTLFDGSLMLDSTYLKAHRTAAILLKKGILHVSSVVQKED